MVGADAGDARADRAWSTSSRSPTASARRLVEDPLNRRPPATPSAPTRCARRPATRPRSGRSSATTCRAGRSVTCRSTAPRSGAADRDVDLPARRLHSRTEPALPAPHRPRRPRLPALCRGDRRSSTTSSTAACIPPPVVAFVHPGERLVEYADDARHHAYLTTELLPQLERELPAGGEPAKRCLVGASFGAVASLSAAVYAPRHVRSPAAAVRLVRRRRHRLLAAPGGAVAAGQAVRPPVHRRSRARRRARVRDVRRVRVADLREPRARPGAREHRHGRDVRRVARRTQLGELARQRSGSALPALLASARG